MAYAEFNDEDVKEFVYPKYGNPDDPLGNRYPKNIRIKYPKTGTTNPSIQINVYEDLASPTPSKLIVQAPTDLGNNLYLVVWVADHKFKYFSGPLVHRFNYFRRIHIYGYHLDQRNYA